MLPLSRKNNQLLLLLRFLLFSAKHDPIEYSLPLDFSKNDRFCFSCLFLPTARIITAMSIWVASPELASSFYNSRSNSFSSSYLLSFLPSFSFRLSFPIRNQIKIKKPKSKTKKQKKKRKHQECDKKRIKIFTKEKKKTTTKKNDEFKIIETITLEREKPMLLLKIKPFLSNLSFLFSHF